MKVSTLSVLAMASLSMAQRPSDTPICDYYTTALLKQNTPANQLKVLTLVVNTAVIGNYSEMSMAAVPGILTPGTYMGEQVSLAKYFDGSLASTNSRSTGMPTSVNFLDGGGAAPLKMNMPANDPNSAQYTLLTHLYSYFGVLLGCTGVGQDGFPAYGGGGSQYNVHKYMGLEPAEVGYFIQQVGLSAASFGVTEEDVNAAGMSLTTTFDKRCSPPATVVPSQGPQLQSICQADSCPVADQSLCAAQPAYEPQPASPTASMFPPSMPTSSSAPGGSAPAPAPAPVYTGAASSAVVESTGLLGSILAAFMLL